MRQFTRSSVVVAVGLAFALAGCEADTPLPAQDMGDPDKGRTVIANAGCGACHEIPGVSGASGIVGPSLRRFAGRTVIAGVHVNEPQVLVSWLRDAPELSPETGMPEMPISEQEARDAAAYLYTLR